MFFIPWCCYGLVSNGNHRIERTCLKFLTTFLVIISDFVVFQIVAYFTSDMEEQVQDSHTKTHLKNHCKYWFALFNELAENLFIRIIIPSLKFIYILIRTIIHTSAPNIIYKMF